VKKDLPTLYLFIEHKLHFGYFTPHHPSGYNGHYSQPANLDVVLR